jgi:hypothetical protein
MLVGDTHMRDESLRLGAPLELWYDLVREGEARVRTPLPDIIESYLVFMLQRHQGDPVLGGRTMALDWLAGLERVGGERADALRDVGDRCLLIAGLFPRLAQRRNVQPGYYAALGQAAYGEVAAATRTGYAELFAQLARAFDAMLRVLRGLGAAPLLPDTALELAAPNWHDEFADAIGSRKH